MSDSERAKHAFLSHMRHELRTPVNAIIGYSEMLLEDAQPGAVRDDLEKIQSAGRKLLGLINDLLDPARMQGSVDGASLSQFGAQVRHELRTPVNAVIGYSEMLLEEAEALSDGAARDVRKIHGAGHKLLGLIEDIIKLSKVASGSVDVGLQSPKVQALIQDVVRTIKPLSAEEPRSAPAGRILVVDDNEVNRDMLSRRLEREGYEAQTAVDGLDALRAVHAGSFDVVLLDILMPGLNGYEVLERLKADPQTRHIPVIMISALDEVDSVVRCIENGASDYLPKPFNPVLLRARIGACLEQKRLRDREVLHLAEIEEQRRKSDELLHVILPHEIVEELKATQTVKPRRHERVAVMFCDIVGFTPFCATRSPDEIVAHLQELVISFEELAVRHQLLKIKTIGDSFMASAGLITPLPNPALNCVHAALDMLLAVRGMSAGWDVRVGIHVGPVTAGVVGRRTYLFDLWGDTVNTAARVESHGQNGAVNVSAAAWEDVQAHCQGHSRGTVNLKGKGEMELFVVERLRPA